MHERLAGFSRQRVDVGEAMINTLACGKGEPLLLLHGYPQTHMMWHKVAPRLAEKYTVVLTDLRGYGDSSCPEAGPDHMGYSKRKMAEDQVKVMEKLGFKTFFLAGHDRGARVCHQMMLDHADRIRRAVLLDVIPTPDMYERVDMEFGAIYYHWFFLIQKHDFPERLIGSDPERIVRAFIQWLSNNREVFPDDVMQHYIEKFSNPQVIHATCEDYRAGATVDMEHIRSGGKVQTPLFVLWGAPGLRRYDVLEIWRQRARAVSGFLVEESGHYIAEEAPELTIRAIEEFLSANTDVMSEEQIRKIKQGSEALVP